MKLETDQDLEIAVSRLAQRTPDSLANFIASFACESGPIGEFELLVSLIERDGDAMEQCGDYHDSVAAAVNRAIRLVAKAGRSLPEEEVRRTLERLIAEDAYGTRETLTEVAARFAP